MRNNQRLASIGEPSRRRKHQVMDDKVTAIFRRFWVSIRPWNDST